MNEQIEIRKQHIDNNKHIQAFLNRKLLSLEESYRLIYKDKEEDNYLKEFYKKLYKTIS